MARSPARDNLHSRVVVILKITLPLVALAMLSSLFLFSPPIDPEDAIPYADVEIADRLAQPRMEGAGFSTVTSDGATLTLSADQAAPQTQGASATGMTGNLVTADGARTEFSAPRAVLDSTAATLTLSEGVHLATSSGYVVETDAVTMATDRSFLESTGPVQATAPFGAFSAGAMRMERAADGTGHVMVFNKGVRLIYQPSP